MNPKVERRVEHLLKKLTLREKISLLSGKNHWSTMPIERLGIPALVMTDGPHGVRADRPEAGRPAGPTTYFPTGASMAASWDPALIERVAQALAEEALAMGCDILLGPCVNIVRAPLAGRNFESYSEDPYLAGRIGVAWVKGLQSQGVGASLKHYACNNCETERNRGSSVVDERTLREIYLPQFEAVVKEAQPWTVMCSYNRINGVYASQNAHLLREILRGEWGFEGVVVSDWGANHAIFESVAGGLDLEMPGPARYYGRLLEEAVHNWQIAEALIDDAARRILGMVVISGRMDRQAGRPAGAVNTREHQRLARELAEESITLLKNKGAVLPLDVETLKSVAVIGPSAAEVASGGGSSRVVSPYRVSPLEGLKARLGEGVENRYEQGCDNVVEPPTLKAEYVTPAGGSGNGFKAEYFANADLSGKPAVEQMDKQIEMWAWGNDPVAGVSYRQFSVRWTGKLRVPESGLYEFRLAHTAVGRLILDGKLLTGEAAKQAATSEHPYVESTVQVELTGGRAYDLKVEFLKKTEDPIIHYHLLMGRVFRPGEDDRIARAVKAAKRSDVAIVFAGMPEGYETEGWDRPNMELPGRQNELIAAVAAANRRTIVVLSAGSPVTMPWLDDVAAVLEVYCPGQECGHALARVLCGDVNPSGKLAVTFPRRLEDNPAFVNSSYPGCREVLYGEGIFVGYRYYDEKDVQPLFPFGFGLSYTTFVYGPTQAPETVALGEPLQVSVRVTNTGDRAGKEVVQLYVADKECSVPRPPQELKGFEKVALKPGESKTVTFTLDGRALSFYDPDRKEWVAEPGEFEVLLGSSSRDIRSQATFKLV